MAGRRVLKVSGSVFLAFGVLVLLFVAYQLWGTSLTTRWHQEQLRQQFEKELSSLHRHSPVTTTSTLPAATTTTTAPISGVQQPQAGAVPAEGRPIGIIDIPTIGANYVVVEGTSTSDLTLGPGHYAGTPLPGQPGNAAIAGHRTTYLHPFYNVNQLNPGDPIFVTTTQGRFEYKVTEVIVVSPTDVSVLNPTPTPQLTLTTCNPRYSAAQRLVVEATLVTPPAPAPLPAPIRTAPRQTNGRSLKKASHQLAGESGSAWAAIGWGVLCLALATTTGWLARRRQVVVRLCVYGGGILLLTVPLFLFFQSITPLLPASY